MKRRQLGSLTERRNFLRTFLAKESYEPHHDAVNASQLPVSTLPYRLRAQSTTPPSDVGRTQALAPPHLATREGLLVTPTGLCENSQTETLTNVELDHPPETRSATSGDDAKKKDLQRLFVHLNRVTQIHQRLIATAFSVLQRGCKRDLAARLFIVISEKMELEKKRAIDVLAEAAVMADVDFKAEFDRTIQHWNVADANTIVPPIADLQALSGVLYPRRRRSNPIVLTSDSVGELSDSAGESLDSAGESLDLAGEWKQRNQSNGSGLSHEEFARLLIIIRDHPEVTNNLQWSSNDFSRRQLNVDASRISFWTARVEGLFNDPKVLMNERLGGALSHIDPGIPVTEFRSGSFLHELFAMFVKEFAEIYTKWHYSGNKDPAAFVKLCNIPGQNRLTRSGTRCLIAWIIFKFGTSMQNNLLLELCSKEMAAATGAQPGRLFITNSAKGESGVIKRRGSQTSGDNVSVVPNVTLSNTFAKEVADEDLAGKNAKYELLALKLATARYENQITLLSNIAEIRKMMEINGNSSDARFNRILKGYYLSLVNKMERELNSHSHV